MQLDRGNAYLTFDKVTCKNKGHSVEIVLQDVSLYAGSLVIVQREIEPLPGMWSGRMSLVGAALIGVGVVLLTISMATGGTQSIIPCGAGDLPPCPPGQFQTITIATGSNYTLPGCTISQGGIVSCSQETSNSTSVGPLALLPGVVLGILVAAAGSIVLALSRKHVS